MFDNHDDKVSSLSSRDKIRLTKQAVSREIVQKIKDYGVDQFQVRHIIFLLALELENNEESRSITKIIKDISLEEENKSDLITDL